MRSTASLGTVVSFVRGVGGRRGIGLVGLCAAVVVAGFRAITGVGLGIFASRGLGRVSRLGKRRRSRGRAAQQRDALGLLLRSQHAPLSGLGQRAQRPGDIVAQGVGRREVAIHQSQLVAIDMIGAGVGEYVLVAQGSAARIGCGVETAPVDAAIVGIIDDGAGLE